MVCAQYRNWILTETPFCVPTEFFKDHALLYLSSKELSNLQSSRGLERLNVDHKKLFEKHSRFFVDIIHYMKNLRLKDMTLD